MEKELLLALNELQSNTIGLFNWNPYDKNDIELVIKNDNGYLTTISLRQLGGFITNHIMADKGRLLLFENNETLQDLKKDPFKLDSVLKSFKI